MSTTALSNAVAKLEANLGVRLFNRTTRSVSLTDAGCSVRRSGRPCAGEHSRRHGRRAVAAGNAVGDTAHQHLCNRGTRDPVAACTGVPPPLSARACRPRRTEGRLIHIVAEGFDSGVRTADLVPSDMIAVALGRPQRHAVVGSPAYLAKHGRPRVPADSLEHRCVRVRLPSGALYPWQLDKRGQTAQVHVTGPITLDEASLARAAVSEGIGLWLLHGTGRARRHRGKTPRPRAGRTGRRRSPASASTIPGGATPRPPSRRSSCSGARTRWKIKPEGYLLGSYRIATAPEPNSSRLTSFKSTCSIAPRTTSARGPPAWDAQ